MTYPCVNNIDTERPDETLRTRILDEYQRFNNHQLTGIDSKTKSVVQILKEPPPKAPKASNRKVTHDSDDSYEDDKPGPILEPMPALSREAEEELIAKCRQMDCSVPMMDISTLDPSDIQRLVKQDNQNRKQVAPVNPPDVEQPSLKFRINKNVLMNNSEAAHKRKKAKKDKKRKKKKKHRQRIESSDESMESDSYNDDSDEDPNYD